jgi:hypothetical protein
MVATLITTLGTLVAGLMGVGAIFGAVNAVHLAVVSQTREVATHRTHGFRGCSARCAGYDRRSRRRARPVTS